jgi:hypothetical protein
LLSAEVLIAIACVIAHDRLLNVGSLSRGRKSHAGRRIILQVTINLQTLASLGVEIEDRHGHHRQVLTAQMSEDLVGNFPTTYRRLT